MKSIGILVAAALCSLAGCATTFYGTDEMTEQRLQTIERRLGSLEHGYVAPQSADARGPSGWSASRTTDQAGFADGVDDKSNSSPRQIGSAEASPPGRQRVSSRQMAGEN